MGRRKDYRPGGIKFADGFQNAAARLGLGQDNLLARSGYAASGARLSGRPQELEEMYRTAWVVARMVEVVAEDMLRAGIDLQSGMDEGDKTALLRAYRGLAKGGLSEAVKWGRLYGGAAAVILIDGQGMEEPLRLESVGRGSFQGLYVLDRWQIQPDCGRLITELGPDLGLPEYYTIYNEDMSDLRLHHSRLMRFIGVALPRRLRPGEQYWGASVVERAYDRILALDSATHGTANMLYKSFLRVIGIENYRQIMSSGGRAEEGLLKMFTFIRQMQSNEGITLIDKNDSFTTHGWTFGGIYDAIQTFNEQISGALGVPLARLLGQSPRGFSSGDADLRAYYDTVLTQIDDDLAGPQQRIFQILSRHLWGRNLPQDFSFDYRSLYSPTETEKSQIATADAQAVAALHSAGIISRSRALAELKDSSRLTGRFAGISAEDIAAAADEEAAPDLPEG
jgi:phage-related protein (TIGR01555 family)